MQPKITPDSFRSTQDLGNTIFIKKNRDYGNSFEESVNKFGLIAGLVRLEDKLNRAATLAKQTASVTDESMYDTLIDAGNYAYMLATYIGNIDPSMPISGSDKAVLDALSELFPPKPKGGKKRYATRAKHSNTDS